MTIYRHDYQAPAWSIETVDLTFDLDPQKTRVLNRMHLRRNSNVADSVLRLDGEDLNLARVLVNGAGCSFRMEGSQLVLDGLPDECDLEIFTTCNPSKNTQLMGLYMSSDTFFTQCEAQGFRRITYFLDRPDVMARYKVTLRADRQAFPVLLSNGNLIESGPLEDGRHYAVWEDPHKKPSYLFALVAGRLVAREQRIRSAGGKDHLLQIYVRPGDLDKTEHAMNSLMASVAWDEARFGLPLDLDRFMIVATSDFNMGAMENKGLNIFNTKYVLASPATATDVDFANVESVVAHEYFHNWTGNRITCRDWFQLSLKEGLTVFRDQEFSMDMAGSASAKAVKRIEDVRVLRSAQFAEDAGPMAHPVRPDQYDEINNFYTLTVYEKGAEVVRMMQTLVGRQGFASGMKTYFDRHDGQAVTCDDFAQSIADANPNSALTQHLDAFKRWYSQAGTPRVQWNFEHNEAQQTLTLTLRQHTPNTVGQSNKQPQVIPVLCGLVGANGEMMNCVINGQNQGAETLLVLTEVEQQFVFEQVPSGTLPSVLRGFSAPVVLQGPLSDAQWLHLLAHDSDAFNRWEAAQQLMVNTVLRALETNEAGAFSPAVIKALRQLLNDPYLSAAYKDVVLTLPGEAYLSEQVSVVNPQRIHEVRESLREQLARELKDEWETCFAAHDLARGYQPDAESSGTRALAYQALTYLVLDARRTGDVVWPGKALQRFKDAQSMTDRVGALSALVQANHDLAQVALDRFHQLFKGDDLVIDKWFALQAGRCDRGGDVLADVKRLLNHPDFNLKNPNRARSVLTTYCQGNPAAFHRADAAGYVLWADKVLEIDAFNPQVAARLARAMDRWSQLASPWRDAAKEAVRRVAEKSNLSKDVREVVSRALMQD
mgnify:CR=1 FL=1